MTDPDMADATYVEPITPAVVAKIIAAERPDALLPTMGGQTALNTALALFRDGTLDKYGVELIGADAVAIDKAEDRLKFRDAMDAIGLESPRSRIAHSLERRDGGARVRRSADDHPAVVHDGRDGGRHRVQPGGVRPYRRHGARRLADDRGADRGIGPRLEGIRDGGRPRPPRQRDHHLRHREYRPDGRPHRRQHHRRADPDADRQGISDHAQREHRVPARDRRRDRRVRTSSSRSTRRTGGSW